MIDPDVFEEHEPVKESLVDKYLWRILFIFSFLIVATASVLLWSL